MAGELAVEAGAVLQTGFVTLLQDEHRSSAKMELSALLFLSFLFGRRVGRLLLRTVIFSRFVIKGCLD